MMKSKSILAVVILLTAAHYTQAQAPRINVKGLFNSQTITQPIPQCKMTADQLTSFRGIKLGMTVSQPNDTEPHRRFLGLEDDFGTRLGPFTSEDRNFLRNFDSREIKSLEMISLNSKLVGYEIKYSRNAAWNSLSSILPKFSAALNLPDDAWRTTETMGDAEFESKMFCDGFTAVLTGNKTAAGNNLVLKIETNYKDILEAEKRRVLSQRAEAFKP